MKGQQRRAEPMFACVRLEELIPAGHILGGIGVSPRNRT